MDSTLLNGFYIPKYKYSYYILNAIDDFNVNDYINFINNTPEIQDFLIKKYELCISYYNTKFSVLQDITNKKIREVNSIDELFETKPTINIITKLSTSFINKINNLINKMIPLNQEINQDFINNKINTNQDYIYRQTIKLSAGNKQKGGVYAEYIKQFIYGGIIVLDKHYLINNVDEYYPNMYGGYNPDDNYRSRTPIDKYEIKTPENDKTRTLQMSLSGLNTPNKMTPRKPLFASPENVKNERQIPNVDTSKIFNYPNISVKPNYTFVNQSMIYEVSTDKRRIVLVLISYRDKVVIKLSFNESMIKKYKHEALIYNYIQNKYKNIIYKEKNISNEDADANDMSSFNEMILLHNTLTLDLNNDNLYELDWTNKRTRKKYKFNFKLLGYLYKKHRNDIKLINNKIFFMITEYNSDYDTLHNYIINYTENNELYRQNMINIYYNIVKTISNLNKYYGLIHGDLHTENVLIKVNNDNSVNVKCFDFDFASIYDNYLTNEIIATSNFNSYFKSDNSLDLFQKSNINMHNLGYMFDCWRLYISILRDSSNIKPIHISNFKNNEIISNGEINIKMEQFYNFLNEIFFNYLKLDKECAKDDLLSNYDNCIYTNEKLINNYITNIHSLFNDFYCSGVIILLLYKYILANNSN